MAGQAPRPQLGRQLARIYERATFPPCTTGMHRWAATLGAAAAVAFILSAAAFVWVTSAARPRSDVIGWLEWVPQHFEAAERDSNRREMRDGQVISSGSERGRAHLSSRLVVIIDKACRLELNERGDKILLRAGRVVIDATDCPRAVSVTSSGCQARLINGRALVRCHPRLACFGVITGRAEVLVGDGTYVLGPNDMVRWYLEARAVSIGRFDPSLDLRWAEQVEERLSR